MSVFIGLSTWGNTIFEDDSQSVRGIQYAQVSKSIVEQIDVKGSDENLIHQVPSVIEDLSAGTMNGLSYNSNKPTITKLKNIQLGNLSNFTLSELQYAELG